CTNRRIGRSCRCKFPSGFEKTLETVAPRPSYWRGGNSRLFACNQIRSTPKSPHFSAPFCLFLYYQNASSLQILGEGGAPNSRRASLQAPASLREKFFRRAQDFSTNPVGPESIRRGRVGRDGPDGGRGRSCRIGPSGPAFGRLEPSGRAESADCI